MSKLKQLIGEGRAIFASVLCLLSCVLVAPSAQAKAVEYTYPIYVGNIASNGIERWETNAVSSYALVEGATSRVTWGETGATNWYVVAGEDVKIEGGVTCKGFVNLILTDGAKLMVTNVEESHAGIATDMNGGFTIYGQPDGSGALEVYAGECGAGIGGNSYSAMDGVAGTNITINGGTVTANGGWGAAGIGGGYRNYPGSGITINGGVVTANGGWHAAGIGGSEATTGSDITINGGVVRATSAALGAGIGGGSGAIGWNIAINGGSVAVSTASMFDSRETPCALIGSGYNAQKQSTNVFVSSAANVLLNLTGRYDEDEELMEPVVEMPASFKGFVIMTPATQDVDRVLVGGLAEWAGAQTATLTNAVTGATGEIVVDDMKKMSFAGAFQRLVVEDGVLTLKALPPELTITQQPSAGNGYEIKAETDGDEGIVNYLWQSVVPELVDFPSLTNKAASIEFGTTADGTNFVSGRYMGQVGTVAVSWNVQDLPEGGVFHFTCTNQLADLLAVFGTPSCTLTRNGNDWILKPIEIDGHLMICLYDPETWGPFTLENVRYVGETTETVGEGAAMTAFPIDEGKDGMSYRCRVTYGHAGIHYTVDSELFEFATAEPIPSSVAVPENATVAVYANGVLSADGSVWSNKAATVVYTAKEGYMFKFGQKTITQQLDTTVNPAVAKGVNPGDAIVEWADEREIAIDTRARIVVGSPEEVLPIAYSTNNWGTAVGPDTGWVAIGSAYNGEPGSQLLPLTNVSGYVEWQPTAGKYGRYTVGHRVSDNIAWGDMRNILVADIYYGAPYAVTWNEVAGGTLKVLVEGREIASGDEVISCSSVKTIAEPTNLTWKLRSVNVYTNNAAGLKTFFKQDFDDRSTTNSFTMPFGAVGIEQVFCISDAYRAELLADATNSYVSTTNALEKLRLNRLTDAETDKALADARTAFDKAVGTIGSAPVWPTTAKSAFDTLESELDDIEEKAQKASDDKPYEFVIADDFTANPPFENYDAKTGTFAWNGQVWTNGVNAFTSFTDAFTNETYGAYATNLHVFGMQTIASESPMVDTWNLDLVAYETAPGVTKAPIVSVGTTDGTPSELVNITNKLGRITGAGEIILSKTKNNVNPSIYDEYIADGAEIKVVNSGVEPSIGSGNIEFAVDENAKVKTFAEGLTRVLLPGVENLDGNIGIRLSGTATNDVLVAGSLVAPNGGVYLQNDSTNVLSVSGKIAAKALYINNHGRQDGREGSILVLEATVSGDVDIQNNAHLEAHIVAGGKISVCNGNVNTLVGTYAGSAIELSGADPGALSNATFVSDGPVKLNGRNVLTGPFTISAPSVNNSSEVSFSVANDNRTTWLNDFDLVSTNQPSATFGVLVDADQTEDEALGVYTIASKATSAVGKAFSVSGGSVSKSILAADGTDISDVEAKTLYIGAKAFSLRVDANGALVFEVKWGMFAITYDAMGGVWSNGRDTANVDAFVNKGYAFPADCPVRENYTFDGWYRSWTNAAVRVAELNPTASPVTPLQAHTLWAKWTPVSTKPTDKDMALLDIADGQPVLAIAPGAYAQKTHPDQAFESFATPIYLKSIGDNAFQGATALKKLIITRPRDYADARQFATLTIGKQAFASCPALEEIRIPEGVSSIGVAAFMNCGKLKRIVFTGTQTLAYDLKALYRCGYENGAGELKVYMKQAFKDNNAALLADLANWNTTLSVVPVVDAFPVSGSPASIMATDFGTLGTDRKVALLVKVPMEIPGTKPSVSSVAIKHSTTLGGATWTTLTPVYSSASDDGTILIEVEMPEGSAGFMKVEIK